MRTLFLSSFSVGGNVSTQCTLAKGKGIMGNTCLTINTTANEGLH